jgi:hypothetical protein
MHNNFAHLQVPYPHFLDSRPTSAVFKGAFERAVHEREEHSAALNQYQQRHHQLRAMTSQLHGRSDTLLPLPDLDALDVLCRRRGSWYSFLCCDSEAATSRARIEAANVPN